MDSKSCELSKVSLINVSANVAANAQLSGSFDSNNSKIIF